MLRIMIFGGSGSGKSTLARQIGAALDLPIVHMDHIYWQPGWVQRPADQVLALALAAAKADRWVIDGNHSASMEARAARADLLVWLDIPRRTRVWHVLKRVATHWGRRRPDMAPGCPERFDWPFLRDFVIGYDRKGETSGRARAQAFITRWQGQRQVIILRSPGDISERSKIIVVPPAEPGVPSARKDGPKLRSKATTPAPSPRPSSLKPVRVSEVLKLATDSFSAPAVLRPSAKRLATISAVAVSRLPARPST